MRRRRSALPPGGGQWSSNKTCRMMNLSGSLRSLLTFFQFFPNTWLSSTVYLLKRVPHIFCPPVSSHKKNNRIVILHSCWTVVGISSERDHIHYSCGQSQRDGLLSGSLWPEPVGLHLRSSQQHRSSSQINFKTGELELDLYFCFSILTRFYLG